LRGAQVQGGEGHKPNLYLFAGKPGINLREKTQKRDSENRGRTKGRLSEEIADGINHLTNGAGFDDGDGLEGNQAR